MACSTSRRPSSSWSCRRGPDAAAFAAAPRTIGPLVPVIDLHVRVGETVLRWFSVVSTIGTPVDVTAQELRLEAFFPSDADTEDTWRAMVARPTL